MKSAKCNEHQNQSSEVFWAQKPQIQSKKSKTVKEKIPMPPLFVYRLNCLPLLFSLGLQQKNQQKQELYFDYDCENCFNIALDDPSGT